MPAKKCRICFNNLKKIIDLGKIALVGDFVLKKKRHKTYRITLNHCKVCKHLQIAEYINPKKLFKKYLWETGVSSTNTILIDNLIHSLKKYKISSKSKVFEIACNDGTLLSLFKKKIKCKVLGIDPANLKLKNLKKNIIKDFFNYKKSIQVKKKYGQFDFIIARNVIAHLTNPNNVMQGVEKLLNKKGVFIIEVPHLLNIIKKNQYDNIFHEHIGFHSLKSIIDLCKNFNLKVIDVDLIQSQGGSLRCYIVKNESKLKIEKKINIILKKETKSGLFNQSKLKNFSKKIKTHKKLFFKLIKNLHMSQKKISVYGASGKGMALMQYCNLNGKFISNIFDKSKIKINRYSPGFNIKVIDRKLLNVNSTDILVLLAWNLKNEIIKQENFFLKNGGKLVLPFPQPKIISYKNI